MAEIFYDDHMVGIFGMVANHCYAKGFDKDWVNKLWEGLFEQPALYDEFIQYFNTGEVAGSYTLHGYTVLEAFIWQMKHYSLTHDLGRNGDVCDKDEMVLRSFEMMIDLYHDPKRWSAILDQDTRIDWIDNP